MYRLCWWKPMHFFSRWASVPALTLHEFIFFPVKCLNFTCTCIDNLEKVENSLRKSKQTASLLDMIANCTKLYSPPTYPPLVTNLSASGLCAFMPIELDLFSKSLIVCSGMLVPFHYASTYSSSTSTIARGTWRKTMKNILCAHETCVCVFVWGWM